MLLTRAYKSVNILHNGPQASVERPTRVCGKGLAGGKRITHGAAPLVAGRTLKVQFKQINLSDLRESR